MRKVVAGLVGGLLLAMGGVAAPAHAEETPSGSATSGATAAASEGQATGTPAATATAVPIATPSPTSATSAPPTSVTATPATPTPSTSAPSIAASATPATSTSVAAASALATTEAAPSSAAPGVGTAYCADYPATAERMNNLYGLFSGYDEDDPPSAEESYPAVKDVLDTATALQATQGITAELQAAVASLTTYFQAILSALDGNTVKPGYQVNINAIQDLMSDAKRAEIEVQVRALAYDSAVYCGLEIPQTPTGAPSTVVTSNDRVSVAQIGNKFTFAGKGFQPGETVTAVITSTPVTLPSQVADSSGKVTFAWSAPSTFAAGAHTITLTGSQSGPVALKFTVRTLANTGVESLADGVSLAALAAMALAVVSALAAVGATHRRPHRVRL